MDAGGSFPEPKGPPIVLVTDDPIVRRRVEAGARSLEALLLPFRSVAECEVLAPPRAFVIDLQAETALDAVVRWKEAFADTPVIGVLSVPRPELWQEAERAGTDVVVTHGVVGRRLGELLEEYDERMRGRRRVRVAPLNDFEGRLGYVGRISDGVPEEIALYHVGYEICAVANTCPHAGARLSDGDLDGSTITCPAHGSQFDVCSGERLRGPADDALRAYTVVVDAGSVFVEWDRP